jgi:hypothetical protein
MLLAEFADRQAPMEHCGSTEKQRKCLLALHSMLLVDVQLQQKGRLVPSLMPLADSQQQQRCQLVLDSTLLVDFADWRAGREYSDWIELQQRRPRVLRPMPLVGLLIQDQQRDLLALQHRSAEVRPCGL